MNHSTQERIKIINLPETDVKQDLSFEDITYDPTNLLDYIWSEPSFGPFRLDVNDLTNLNLRYWFDSNTFIFTRNKRWNKVHFEILFFEEIICKDATVFFKIDTSITIHICTFYLFQLLLKNIFLGQFIFCVAKRVTSMLVMDVGDKMCWWQLLDVREGFGHFGH